MNTVRVMCLIEKGLLLRSQDRPQHSVRPSKFKYSVRSLCVKAKKLSKNVCESFSSPITLQIKSAAVCEAIKKNNHNRR